MRDMPVARAAAAVAFALTAAGAQAEAPYAFGSTPGKLPKDVIPLQYSAHIVPDVAGNSFRGTQTVEIEVLKRTSTIMLNADNLEIDSASLSGKEIGKLPLKPILDKGQQTLRFELAQPLAPGKYALDLAFKGQINREGRGLFYVNYKAGGADKKLIATTMAPTDARRMLPSWDEPSFRARFKLTVDVPGNFKAYSTTPIEKQEPLPKGMQRVTFGNTPKMPSYLVVLVAGELERVAAKQDGVEIGVVTTEGKGASAAFPLQASRDLLHERTRAIYLRSSPEELVRRVRHDTNRPLLQVADPLARLKQLYAQRDPLYREVAHFVIETGRPSVPTLVNMILMQLELAGPGTPAP